MENVADLAKKEKLDHFILKKCELISEGVPEIFRLANDLALTKMTEEKKPDLIKLFQRITNKHSLFVTIKKQIQEKVVQENLTELCARTGILRGMEKRSFMQGKFENISPTA